jgi:hypothetical protein
MRTSASSFSRMSMPHPVSKSMFTVSRTRKTLQKGERPRLLPWITWILSVTLVMRTPSEESL